MKYFIFIGIFLFAYFVQGQNVGINVNNPTATLDIDGNFRLTDGSQDEGKVLTSDALGFGSWQTPQAMSSPSIGYGKWNPCENPNLCEYQPVFDGNKEENDFGYRVAIEGGIAAIASPDHEVTGLAYAGSVYVYHFSGNTWSLLQTLVDPTPDANNYFGISLALSGDWLFIGSLGDQVGANLNQGSVCIFKYNGTSYDFFQKIYGIDVEASDYFGSSLDVNGNTAIIGSDYDSSPSSTNHFGSVTIFNYSGVLNTWIVGQKFFHPLSQVNGEFGYSVAISEDKFVVGAPGSYNGEGTAHVYHKIGPTWFHFADFALSVVEEYAYFGSKVDIYGDDIIISAPDKNLSSIENVGEVSFYSYDGTFWNLNSSKYLQPMEIDQTFGSSVSLSNGYALVGSYQSTIENNYEGKCILYQKVGNTWTKLESITDPSKDFGDKMGFCAIDGFTKRFVLGAPGFQNNSGKAIFGKFKN